MVALNSPAWLPSDNSLLAASMDPESANTTVTVSAGTVYLAKLMLRNSALISNLLFNLTTAGSGASTGSFAGLYSPAGLLLSGSADIAAALTGSTGIITVPLSTPQNVTGPFVWAAFVANLAVTQPTLARAGASSASTNMNLAAALARFATNGSGTSLAASITPGSNVITANALLVGAT